MATDAMTGGGMAADDDRLPWLEAVEDEDERQGPSAAKLIGALVIGLAAIAAIIFALFQLGNNDAGGAEVIAPESASYKERPADAGGLKVEGEGDTAFAASEGADPNARINLDAIPEAPVEGARGVAPAEQMKINPDARAAQVAPPIMQPAPQAEPSPAPVATPSVSGPAVQLGAFSSNAAAQSAWKSMSGRFESLKPLTNAIVPVTVGGKTMYRLRAGVGSRADANTLCGKLKVAGESCVVV